MPGISQQPLEAYQRFQRCGQQSKSITDKSIRAVHGRNPYCIHRWNWELCRKFCREKERGFWGMLLSSSQNGQTGWSDTGNWSMKLDNEVGETWSSQRFPCPWYGVGTWWSLRFISNQIQSISSMRQHGNYSETFKLPKFSWSVFTHQKISKDTTKSSSWTANGSIFCCCWEKLFSFSFHPW